MGRAEELRLGHDVDEEGEVLPQRHLREGLGAEPRDEEHDGEEVVHQVLGAERAELQDGGAVHGLVPPEGGGGEPAAGAGDEGQGLLGCVSRGEGGIVLGEGLGVLCVF